LKRNPKAKIGKELAGRTIKEFETETLKENIKKAQTQQKEIKQKLKDFSQKNKTKQINYTEYEYLINQYLKGKSHTYWNNYYETYIQEAREQIKRTSRLEDIIEEPKTKKQKIQLNPTLIAIIFVLGFFFMTNYTGLFIYEPTTTVEFDVNESWNLSTTFLRVSLGNYTEDISAENLVNNSKILLYVPGLNLSTTGRLYADLIMDNELIDSKYADVTIEETNETFIIEETETNQTVIVNETEIINETTTETIVLIVNETKNKIKLKDKTGTLETETAGEKIKVTATKGKTKLVMKGVETTAEFEIKTEDNIIAIKKTNELNIDNATITLPKTRKIKAIGYCPDENFDFENLICTNWEITDIPFADHGDTIEFTVEHFSAYSGLSAVTIEGVNLSKYGVAENMPINYSGLAAWYKLEQGNGSFWNDSSGNNNFGTQGTAANQPTYTAEGAIGGAYYFDGTDDYISSDTPITDLPFTMCNWLKTDMLTGVHLTSTLIDISEFDYYFGIGISGSNFVLYARNQTVSDTTTTFTPTINTNTWYYLCGVFTNETSRTIYTNGNKNLEDTTNVNIGTGTIDKQLIGILRTVSATGYYNGTIDEVQVFNRTLSAQEITNLYNRTKNIYTDHDLGASVVNATDGDGDNLSYVYDWRQDGTSIAVLNMPFDLNGTGGSNGK